MARRVIVLCLVVILVIVPSVSVLSSGVQIGEEIGPNVDGLIFRVLSHDVSQVLALQNDEIDMIAEYLDVELYSALSSSEDFDITQTLRNGYGYVTLNTAKYPLNITAFRRAIAFAVDKERISEYAFMNLSEPLDSCVPRINPFSAENELVDRFYTPDITKAKQLLADAGFNDTDSDGYIEAPDGSEIFLEVFIPDSSGIPDGVGEVFETALQELDIDYVRETDDWITDIYRRLNFHQDYDIAFLMSSYNVIDVDQLVGRFRSENVEVPYYNYPNFRNLTFDSYCDQLLYSTDLSSVHEAATEMQKIIAYECPIIVLYEAYDLVAYRNDRFDGHVNAIDGGALNWWTYYEVHLREPNDGSAVSVFRSGIRLDIDTFNLPKSMGHRRTERVLSLMYDSLIRRDHEGNDVLWLAESIYVETHDDNPEVPEGSTRFTIRITENATWTDGSRLDANDVKATLDYCQNMPPVLKNLNGINVLDSDELQVEFNVESYWLLHRFGYKPILPEVVLDELGPDGWQTWNPDPTVEPMLTSGPFNVTGCVRGEYIEFTKNPNYLRPFIPTSVNGGTTTTFQTLGIVSALVIGSVLVWWKRPRRI
ncbi:MAG: ABC transporter substrate-binding protein [Candidatus Thorarchaeota archaeon]